MSDTSTNIRFLPMSAEGAWKAYLDATRDARYAAWDNSLGRSILDGSTDLAALHERAFDRGAPARVSGGQERLENLVARHVARVR